MKFCIHRSVHFNDFNRWLSGLGGIPIELALPHDMQEFWSIVGRLGELAAYVRDNGLLVNSVHAPHGRLSGNAFMAWAPQVTRFAERTGAEFVVYHPEGGIAKARKHQFQAAALGNIKTLRGRTNVSIAIETFKNRSRVFTPLEIMERGLPMVLDTSRIPEELTFELIIRYSGSIIGVHLSENRLDSMYSEKALNHLPLESSGIEVLQALRAQDWDGPVTLEYLPDHEDRLLPDRQRLEEMFR